MQNNSYHFLLTESTLMEVDTLGTLHYFGVTVNLISSIDLVMATGIGVDYSAHIALAFIMAKGNVKSIPVFLRVTIIA